MPGAVYGPGHPFILRTMLLFIDNLSGFCARLSAWIFFIIGGIIVYEVVARYVFLAPTVWSEEISRFLQIWATYLAAAFILQQRQLIAIDIVVRKLPIKLQIFCECLSLAVIGIFCLVAVVFGLETAIESIRVGRATSTMIAVPLWMTEIAIPIGFGLLLLQVIAEFCRVLSGRLPSSSFTH